MPMSGRCQLPNGTSYLLLYVGLWSAHAPAHDEHPGMVKATKPLRVEQGHG